MLGAIWYSAVLRMLVTSSLLFVCPCACAPVASNLRPLSPPKGPTLHVLKDSTEVDYGCSDSRIEILNKAINEAFLLVKDAIRLLDDDQSLEKSSARHFLGTTSSFMAKHSFSRMVHPLSSPPSPIERHLEITRDNVDDHITVECHPPDDTIIASNLDPIGAYDDNGIPVYKRGHVIQLRPVFFREIQLQQALDSLRNGELARATAGMTLIHELTHNTAITGHYGRLEDLTNVHSGLGTYESLDLLSIDENYRFQTADAPPYFALHAHWYWTMHKERTAEAVECPVANESPPVAKADSVHKISTAPTGESNQPKTPPLSHTKIKGWRKIATSFKVGKQRSGRSPMNTERVARRATHNDHHEVRGRLSREYCRPRIPITDWSHFATSS